jgi:TolB protein
MVTVVVVVLGWAAARAEAPAPWRPESADLLFASSRHGNSEVYLLPAGQKDWINLSSHEAGDNWPVWSPDGSRIVFQSTRAGKLDIFTMKVDGSEQVQLTDHPEPDYLPSWSPDGKTILFTSWRKEPGEEERAPHIYAMDADGSNERRLVKQSLNTSAGATWSPDGKHIVYERKGDKGADIYVADADGGNERRLTHDQERNVYNGSPTFSPDGRWIAFSSDDETSVQLVVMGVEGKERRTVLADGKNWYPRWSPDGRWLVYTAVAGGDKDNIDVLAVPAAGGGKPVLLVGSPKRDIEGSWRPK